MQDLQIKTWNFLSSITDLLDRDLKPYKDFVIMGDFKTNESNPAMKTFLNQHKCETIIKSKTCYNSQIITSRIIITIITSFFKFLRQE